jgi:hypothetical protein
MAHKLDRRRCWQSERQSARPLSRRGFKGFFLVQRCTVPQDRRPPPRGFSLLIRKGLGLEASGFCEVPQVNTGLQFLGLQPSTVQGLIT